MRAGYIGNQTSITTPTGTPGTILANANMAAADRLLEVAASQYAYDTGLGAPRTLLTAASIGAAGAGTGAGTVLPILSNGATYDPAVNNQAGTLLASAARTASTATGTITNYNAVALAMFLNLTVQSGACALVPAVQMVDPVSGGAQDIASFTAVSSVGGYTYIVGLGAVETAAITALQVMGVGLPRLFRIRVDHSTADSVTYSLGYSFIGQ